MNVGIYQGASALTALECWQETLSQNIAASTVPGYKKDQISVGGIDYGALVDGASSGAASAVLPQSSSTVSFAPGTIQRTGNPNDVAIDSEGFFVVREASGKLRYTRNGEFEINASGQLTTSSGEPVQGTGGPISLLPDGGSLIINPDGQLYQGEQLIGRLRVVEFSDKSGLTKVSGGFYAGDASQPVETSNPRLSQGYLEGSNVSAINEMIQMIQVSRAYEANQKVLQAYDDRLGRVNQTFV